MLSEAMRLLRVFHDMKQGELAEALGISKSYVSEIENGNRVPSFEVIQKYAEIFKVPVSSIIFFAEQIDGAKNKNSVGTQAKRAIAGKILSLLQIIEDRTEPDGIR